MTSFGKNLYTLMGLTSGLAFVLVASPSQAQLDVTGGGATVDNADIFVPTDGNITNGVLQQTDDRAVIYNYDGFNSVTIETNQGTIPTSAIFRANTLPTINNAVGATDLQGLDGRVLGTLTFPSISPQGLLFFNIPTTLNFTVDNSVPVGGGTPLTEFRAEGWILQETGFVADASGIGFVQRQTPVTLVQYGATAEDKTVLGNDVPATAYAAERAGTTVLDQTVDLSFDSGAVFTPPGFTLEGATPDQDQAVQIGRYQFQESQITYLSLFTNVALINLPSFDDIVFDDDVNDDDGGDRDRGHGNDDDGFDEDNPGNSDGTNRGGNDDSSSDDDGGVVGDDSSSDDDVVGDDSSSDDGGVVGDDSSSDDDVVGDDSSSDDDVVADSGDDNSDDQGDDEDEDDDDDIVTNPNDGSNQFRPIFPGFVFIGIFVFNNVPSGRWVDPPSADGFEYEMTSRDVPVGVASRVFPGMTGVGQADDAVFTRISGFPTGVDADDTFVVSVEGTVLGEFSPGDTLRFSDYAQALGDRLVDGGVRKFTISEINPSVNARNPVAFPLQLEFNTDTASFEMRALEATAAGDDTQISSNIAQ